MTSTEQIDAATNEIMAGAGEVLANDMSKSDAALLRALIAYAVSKGVCMGGEQVSAGVKQAFASAVRS